MRRPRPGAERRARSEAASAPILIAGAGIAGLTAALAFAAWGFPVRLFERAPQLEEVGAGLQLSPNATRVLDALGLGAALRDVATRPDAIVLRRGRSLDELARVPLGDAAEERWGAPYLVAHRADLQRVLLAAVRDRPDIHLELDTSIEDAAFHGAGVTATIERAGRFEEVEGRLLVGADGVWSRLRHLMWPDESCRDTGLVAWRSLVERDSAPGNALGELMPGLEVGVFLDPHFHLVAYPLRGGRTINLVAVSRGRAGKRSWAIATDAGSLAGAVDGAAELLTRIVRDAAPWTFWPIFEVHRRARWCKGEGLALIGDAAHAMTPHAAQGAAMAIEDAVELAAAVSSHAENLPAGLRAYEALRRARISRVRRRGRFNRFVWHAAGPIAYGRDLVLARRSPERLAADLDWLYGWRPEGEA